MPENPQPPRQQYNNLGHTDQAHIADNMTVNHYHGVVPPDHAVVNSQPIFFGVPRVTKHFVGREEDLTKLHESIKPGQHTAVIQTIHGNGGIGKTTLAAAYADRMKSAYGAVVWLASQTASDRRNALAALATQEFGASPEAAVDALVAAGEQGLGKLENPLVILDNVEDFQDADTFVNSCRRATCLVTTRQPNLPESFTPYALDVLPLEAAEQLLLDVCHGAGGPIDSGEREAAEALAGEFERLPLLLDQAAIYANQSGWSLKKLQEEWPKLKNTILSHYARQGNAHENLWAMTRASLDRLEAKNPAAAIAVKYLAWLSPDATALEVFTGNPKVWESLTEALTNPAGLWGDVAASGLARRVKIVVVQPVGDELIDAFAMHRAYQEVLREFCGPEVGNDALASLRAVYSNGAFDDPACWPQLRRCLQAADALLARVAGLDQPRLAWLSNQVGFFRRNILGDLDGAVRCFRDAVRHDRAAYGDHHPRAAMLANNIGTIFEARGDVDSALSSFRDAERISRAAYGDDHPEVAISVNNIGMALQDQGDLEGALRCYREAERINRATYGDDHPEVALALTTSAWC